jgi:hypothetical protein
VEVIGKKVNYIKLHNFLDRIEVNQVYSSLHTFYNTLITSMNSDGTIEWCGKEFTKETLLEILKEEEGKLTNINFGEFPGKKFELTLKFHSGNELVVKVASQEQYFQIVDFLYKYQEGE